MIRNNKTIENLNQFPSNSRFVDFLRCQGQPQQSLSSNPAIKYKEDGEYKSINYQQFVQLVNGSAINLKPRLEHIVSGDLDPIPIAFLAPNTKEYIINLLGLVALNLAPIALSVKNSDDILAALVEKSHTKVLAYHPQFQAQADFCKSKVPELNLLLLPQEADLVPSWEVVEPISKRVEGHDYSEDTLAIFHSSGSTSLPKLIKLSNRYAFSNILKERNEHLSEFYHQKVALQFAPFFHAYGFLNFLKITARYSGLAIPSSVLNTKAYLDDIEHYDANYLIIVPSLLDQLADYCTEHDAWSKLGPVELVVTGGTALPNKMIQKFVNQDIHILNDYGSTETGNLAASTLDPKLKNFQRFHLLPGIRFTIINRNEDLGQILILPSDTGLATDMVKPDEDGFLINDIVQIFEERENYFEFEILGRIDDLIIHLNGEKTNPVPMEQDIKLLNYVDQCIIMGSSQLYNVAIIQINPDKLNGKSMEEVRGEVLNQVEFTNAKNPHHSRLLPELVHILPLDEEVVWPLTAKGNFKRHECAKLFQPIIYKLYSDFEEQNSNQVKVSSRTFEHLTAQHLNSEIVNWVSEVTQNSNIDLEKSIFNQGLDSLTVIKFLKLIQAEYPELMISVTLIYENDTVHKLSNYMLNQLQGNLTQAKGLLEHQKEVFQVVDTYSKSIENFLKSNGKRVKQDKEKKTVLLTGANGSLGSLLVEKLVKREDVAQVYCLIRAKSNDEANEKFNSAFQPRRTNVTGLQFAKIQCLRYDQMDPQFGLDSDTYQQLLDKVNLIYHCAYKMNFLLPLANFDDCILACINLIQFNYKTQFQSDFHFVSSIGAILPLQYGNVFPEAQLIPKLNNLEFCNGYNLSKLVLELILTKHLGDFDHKVFIHRLGQLSGDSELGIWNTSDYMPKFIQLIQQMKIAPSKFFFDSITWVPMDTTVLTLIDLGFPTLKDEDNNSKRPNFYHVINPNPVPWTHFLQQLQSLGHEFEIVGNDKFVEELDKLTFHLKDFFVQHTTTFSTFSLDTQVTTDNSISLNSLQPIGEQILTKYLNHWKSIGFVN